MSYYILALPFSVASKILELSPIVPQKKCVPQDILVCFFKRGLGGFQENANYSRISNNSTGTMEKTHQNILRYALFLRYYRQ